MQFIKLLVLGSCLLGAVVLGVACRGELPPTQPPRVVEDAPGTRTDDGLGAAPLAGLTPGSVAAIGGSGGGGMLPLPGGSGGSLGQ